MLLDVLLFSLLYFLGLLAFAYVAARFYHWYDYNCEFQQFFTILWPIPTIMWLVFEPVKLVLTMGLKYPLIWAAKFAVFIYDNTFKRTVSLAKSKRKAK